MGTLKEREKTPNQLPFSKSTEQVMTFAEEEARRLNHRYIGTGDLLLGLLRDPLIGDTFADLDTAQIELFNT